MFLHISCSDNEGDEISKQGTVEITVDWGDYSAEAQLPIIGTGDVQEHNSQ